MQLSLDLGIKRAVHHERSVAGKKMGLFFSHSKKGPVFEHFTKYGPVTIFVIMPLRACYSVILRQISCRFDKRLGF